MCPVSLINPAVHLSDAAGKKPILTPFPDPASVTLPFVPCGTILVVDSTHSGDTNAGSRKGGPEQSEKPGRLGIPRGDGHAPLQPLGHLPSGSGRISDLARTLIPIVEEKCSGRNGITVRILSE